MDAYQLRAPNKINIKAFQLVTKGAVGNELLHHDSRLLLEPAGSKRSARKVSSPWDRKGLNRPISRKMGFLAL